MQLELKVGTLAYIDSFGGLVACKVTDIHRAQYGYEVTAIITAKTAKGYVKGESVTLNQTAIVPRDAVHVRNHKYVIRPYTTIV